MRDFGNRFWEQRAVVGSVVAVAGALALVGCSSREKDAGHSKVTMAAATTPPPSATPVTSTPTPRVAASETPGAASNPIADAVTPAAAASPLPVAARETLVASGSSGTSIAVPPDQRRPFRSDIPMARMGQPKRKSMLDGMAGVGRQMDPESTSVARGRRHVARREDFPMTRMFDSPEACAQDLLDAFLAHDPEIAHRCHVTKTEYETLLWPEFPQSRPAVHIPPDEAFFFYYSDCNKGVLKGLSTWGTTPLHVFRVRFEEGFAPFTNFNLYQGAVIEAKDDQGNKVEVNVAPVFVERNGHWKVFVMKDHK